VAGAGPALTGGRLASRVGRSRACAPGRWMSTLGVGRVPGDVQAGGSRGARSRPSPYRKLGKGIGRATNRRGANVVSIDSGVGLANAPCSSEWFHNHWEFGGRRIGRAHHLLGHGR
jgi:hypothetical protein